MLQDVTKDSSMLVKIIQGDVCVAGSDNVYTFPRLCKAEVLAVNQSVGDIVIQFL